MRPSLLQQRFSAFYLVNLGAVVEKWYEWTSEMPNVDPFYAVKSNPDINIVRTVRPSLPLAL